MADGRLHLALVLLLVSEQQICKLLLLGLSHKLVVLLRGRRHGAASGAAGWGRGAVCLRVCENVLQLLLHLSLLLLLLLLLGVVLLKM